MDLHWSRATLTPLMAELTPAVWWLHLHLHRTNPHPSSHLVGDWLHVVCYVLVVLFFKTLVWLPETRLFLFWDRQLLSWIHRRSQRVETKRNCWNHGTLHLVHIFCKRVSEGFLSNLDLFTWQKLVNVLGNVSHFTYTELKAKINKSPLASTLKWMNLYSNIHAFYI